MPSKNRRTGGNSALSRADAFRAALDLHCCFCATKQRFVREMAALHVLGSSLPNRISPTLPERLAGSELRLKPFRENASSNILPLRCPAWAQVSCLERAILLVFMSNGCQLSRGGLRWWIWSEAKKTSPLEGRGQAFGVMYPSFAPCDLGERCSFTKIGCNNTTLGQECNTLLYYLSNGLIL